MVIFRCDGTYEGILTAVFSGYRSDDVMIEGRIYDVSCRT